MNYKKYYQVYIQYYVLLSEYNQENSMKYSLARRACISNPLIISNGSMHNAHNNWSVKIKLILSKEFKKVDCFQQSWPLFLFSPDFYTYSNNLNNVDVGFG